MKITLLLLLTSLILLYIPLNRQTPKYRLNLSLDRKLPFVPWTIWIYLSYYLLFPLAIIFTWDTVYALPFLITQVIGTASASLVWKLFPNGVIRPDLSSTDTISRKLLQRLYLHDKDCNGFPSGHVLHSFIACYFLTLVFPGYWLIFYLLLMAISLSTLTTKQHYYLDMVCSLLISPFFITISRYVIDRI